MINQDNIEKLFDCFDASSTLLYQTYKIPYLDGLVKTCENIMSGYIDEDYIEIKDELDKYLENINDIDFQKEEIRKAFQYACLRGFKHSGISNQMITPDTIGIFINYLVSNLFSKNYLNVLDPVVGTGNLIATVANNSDKEIDLIGVDNDLQSYKLFNSLLGILEYGDKAFYQDIMTFNLSGLDLILGDFSGVKEEDSYGILKHLSDSTQLGGFSIGIYDWESVKPEKLIKHSKELNELWNLFGMFILPDEILKNKKKAIVIYQRAGDKILKPNKFLFVELPKFDNQIEMKKVINQMNDWFKNTEFKRI